MATLLTLILAVQAALLVAVFGLRRDLRRFETAMSLRVPLPSPVPTLRRPPGPAATSSAREPSRCLHPMQSRVDASVLGRPQFLCLACDETVAAPLSLGVKE